MRGSIRLAAAVALCVAASGVPAHGAPSPECDVATTFRYCGEHVRASKLPMKFSVNLVLAPGGAAEALRGAMSAWNTAWPFPTQVPLSFVGATSDGFGRDGRNTVVFGDPARCGGVGGLAVACTWFEGDSGAARKRIAEVDIIVNPDRPWKDPSRVDVVAGEIDALVPMTFGVDPDPLGSGRWYDLQSVLTHELGHVLGLEDIGNSAAPFPSTLADAPRYTQTMYGVYYSRTTNKRSLDTGDILGLWRAAYDTHADV